MLRAYVSAVFFTYTPATSAVFLFALQQRQHFGAGLSQATSMYDGVSEEIFQSEHLLELV